MKIIIGILMIVAGVLAALCGKSLNSDAVTKFKGFYAKGKMTTGNWLVYLGILLMVIGVILIIVGIVSIIKRNSVDMEAVNAAELQENTQPKTSREKEKQNKILTYSMCVECILKMKEALEAGALTQEEFEKMKKQMLESARIFDQAAVLNKEQESDRENAQADDQEKEQKNDQDNTQVNEQEKSQADDQKNVQEATGKNHRKA